MSANGQGWPLPHWRVDLHSKNFEKEKEATRWDKRRARQLRNQAAKWKGKRRERALALADLLDPQVTLEAPKSPASSRYMRDQRIRRIGGLWKCVAEDKTGIVVRYDVVKPKWSYSVAGLRQIKALQLKREFSADLDRAALKVKPGGASECEGFLYAALHGDFESPRYRYQLHYHVMATGDWAAVIDKMRKQRGYQSSSGVKTPIRTREDLTDLAYALTYILKTYWPGKWKGHVSGVQMDRRTRAHREIPGRFNCHALLWQHQQKLDDMIVMRGICGGKDGLRVM